MSQNVPCGKVLLVLVGILCSHADAQSAQQVLNSQTSSILTSLTSQSYYQNGVTLPTCPHTPALSQAILPDNWGTLSLSDQVKTTAMPYIIQLSHAVYRFFYDRQSQIYPDPSLNPYKECLAAMGMAMPIQTGSNYIEVTNIVGARLTALVVQQVDGRGVFIIFKGTDFGNPGDVATDGDCQQQVTGVAAYLGASTSIGVHRGFYNSWKLLEPMVLKALSQIPPTNVYIIGHSLGGGMGAIAALRLQYKGYNIAGVWLFGQPRVGNEAWQKQYNNNLLSKTLRISNYADFVARLPATVQICPLLSLSNTYRHIGKSVLLCPVTSDLNAGLVRWQLNDTGLAETLDCTPPTMDRPDASLKTHWLGAYTDAWRRAAALAGVDISPIVANTICKECTGCFLPDLNKQVNVVARAGGPIMCSTDASCNVATAWNAATLLAGNSYMRDYQQTSTCLNFMCTYTTPQFPTCPKT